MVDRPNNSNWAGSVFCSMVSIDKEDMEDACFGRKRKGHSSEYATGKRKKMKNAEINCVTAENSILSYIVATSGRRQQMYFCSTWWILHLHARKMVHEHVVFCVWFIGNSFPICINIFLLRFLSFFFFTTQKYTLKRYI